MMPMGISDGIGWICVQGAHNYLLDYFFLFCLYSTGFSERSLGGSCCDILLLY